MNSILIYEISKYQFARPVFHISTTNNSIKFIALCIFACVLHLRELTEPNLIGHTHLYVVELQSDFFLDPPLISLLALRITLIHYANHFTCTTKYQKNTKWSTEHNNIKNNCVVFGLSGCLRRNTNSVPIASFPTPTQFQLQRI